MEIISIFVVRQIGANEIVSFVTNYGGYWSEEDAQGVIERGAAHVFLSVADTPIDGNYPGTSVAAEALGARPGSEIWIAFSPGRPGTIDLLREVANNAANEWDGFVYVEPQLSSLVDLHGRSRKRRSW